MTSDPRQAIPQTHGEYWAKYSEDTEEIHRLEHHLADVGAVMETLLELPGVRRSAAKAGGLSELDPTTSARMCVFAALHDIGKANLGFQAKATRWSPVSHTKDMMQLLNGGDLENQERFMQAIPWLNDAMAHWDRNDGGTVCGMIIAMLSHHGKPECLFNERQPRPRHWVDRQSGLRQQPFEKMREIAEAITHWFPDAFRTDGPILPQNPEFQHHFLGLLMLADWIGSDTRWFPFQPNPDGEHITVARRRATEAVKAIGLDTREQSPPIVPATLAMIADKPVARPNTMQRAISKVDRLAPLVILESETGSGKTEAALLRFQCMWREGLVDGLYFALPTRAAATQVHVRVVNAVRHIMPGAGVKPVLAVPGYIRAGEHDGKTLERYRVHWEDGADDGSRWSAESAKRFLTAQVAVGTIDQAMLSVLQTRHAHLRAACLSRNLLVIDEVHASDTYMRGIVQSLVRNHRLKGGYTLMMSATLGAGARATYLGQDMPNLKAAKCMEYPCVTTEDAVLPTVHGDYRKHVRVETAPVGATPLGVATAALKSQQAGARVLVIRNTVRMAIETAKALQELAPHAEDAMLTVNGKPALHHSRFAPEDRKLLDRAAEKALAAGGSGRGIVVVGTQTLEQSLDIDADYLITDLCPMDVLLQRVGRLHRRHGMQRPDGYQEAKCTVLMPKEDISELINGRSATGLGPRGLVYRDLRVIEATRRQIVAHRAWEIPRMNRELVEESTHPDILKAVVDEAPETWMEHHLTMEGTAYADTMTAKNVLVDWGVPFYDPDIGSNEDVVFRADNVMTRLADPSIDVDFPPGVIGPFGSGISQIAIPFWMIGEDAADWKDAVAEITSASPDGISLRVPTGQMFRYSRLGLEPVSIR